MTSPAQQPARTRPRPRGRARALRRRASPSGATASRAPTATSSSSRRDPRRPRPGARSSRPSAPTPTPAWSSCSSRSPERIAAAPPTIRARPGRCCPTSASSRSRPSRSRTRSPHRPARRLRAGADRAGGGGVALPQQARVLVRRPPTDGGLVCGFHAPGRWDQILPLDDCLLASERGNAAREQVLAWARAEGLRAQRSPRAARARCATSWCARAGARARSRFASWLSPGPLHDDALTAPCADGAAGHDADRWARPRRRRDRAAGRHAADAEGLADLASGSRPRRSSRPTPRWPRSSTPSPSSWRPARARAPLRPLLRPRADGARAQRPASPQVYGVELVGGVGGRCDHQRAL